MKYKGKPPGGPAGGRGAAAAGSPESQKETKGIKRKIGKRKAPRRGSKPANGQPGQILRDFLKDLGLADWPPRLAAWPRPESFRSPESQKDFKGIKRK